MKISVVIGYKNRDTVRVKNTLDSIAGQTMKDLEVIFIDYGSDEKYQAKIKPLVESYSFARYYYNDTRGMPWNRSHALNTGIRLAKADYVLLGDIDWVYCPETFDEMYRLVSEDVRVFCRNYLLSEHVPYDRSLYQNIPPGLTITHEKGGGGAHLIIKKQLEKIHGFDEYYCFWGVEDRDLYSRLDQFGIKSVGIDISKYPVFHQWHPEVSGGKRGFFPDRWWENMNIYYQVNINKLKRNNEQWGKLFSKDERKVFIAKEVYFKINESGDWFHKGIVAFQLVEHLQLLENNECLLIEISKGHYETSRKLKVLSKLISYISSNLILSKNQAGQFNAEQDITYIIWKLIKDSDLIKDYALAEEENKTIVRLMH